MEATRPDAPGYRVVGRVVNDLTGASIAKATVVLSSLCIARDAAGQRTSKQWKARVVSDNEGSFQFDNVPAMTAYFGADREGYQDIWPFRQTPGGAIAHYSIGANTAPITLRLAPSPSLSGLVRGPDHAPVAHVWVAAKRYGAWAGWRQVEGGNSVETGADGSYRFASLLPGRYRLVAQPWRERSESPEPDPQGRAIGLVPVRFPAVSVDNSDSYMELAEGQQAHVDFEFKPEILHHVTGTVSGRDVWPPIIEVFDPAGVNSYPLKVAARCCGFEAWLPNGRFSLEAQFAINGCEFIGSAPIEVRDVDVEGVVFPLLKRTNVEIPIEIRAEDTSKADAVVKAEYLQLIHLRLNGSLEAGPQSTLAGWMKPTRSVRTESITAMTGTYPVVLAVTGNVYARSITRGATDLIRQPLVVRPGDAQETIRVVVAEGAMVEGVTRREGSPLPAWVYAVPERPDARLLNRVASDANGKFHLEGLAPDRYLFFASDVEVPFDVHDAADMRYWQPLGQSLTLEAGKTAVLDLGTVRK